MCAKQSRHWGHHIEPEAYTVALGGLEQRNDMLWHTFYKGPADCSADHHLQRGMDCGRETSLEATATVQTKMGGSWTSMGAEVKSWILDGLSRKHQWDLLNNWMWKLLFWASVGTQVSLPQLNSTQQLELSSLCCLMSKLLRCKVISECFI